MSVSIECEYLLKQSFCIGLLPRLIADRFERYRSISSFFILLCLSTWLYSLWCLLQDLLLELSFNFNAVMRILQHVLINILYLEFLIVHHYVKFDKLQLLWASLLRIDVDFLAYFNMTPSKMRFINAKLLFTNAIFFVIHGLYFWTQPSFVFLNEIFIKFGLHTIKFIVAHILLAIRLRLQAIGYIIERNEACKLNAHDVLIRIHSRCADAIDLCNELYGVNFALSVLHLVLYVLRLVSVVVDKSRGQGTSLLLMLTLWTVYGFVQAFVVVYMSQKVADVDKENIAKLYKAMNLYNDAPMLHKRLSRLARQMQARSPCLSAAGFFNVDLSMLFMLVNLITTYTIVVVQFSTSQSQPCQANVTEFPV